MSTELIAQIRAHRATLEARGRAILNAADAAGRNSLTDSEDAEFRQITEQLEGIDDQIARHQDYADRTAETEAAFRQLGVTPHGSEPHGKSEDPAVEAFRSMLVEGNPKPIELRSDVPGTRLYQPGLERRDLSKTAPASFTRTSMHNQIIQHAVDASAVLRAGATVLTTDSGENLLIPRSTALSTASIITEGSAITESDPTLSSVTLGAHKYAILVQVTRELIEDTSVNLQEYLARETGQAIGLALGNHLINGTGTGQPRGVLADSTAGITGPTGTATSLGTQATAGQGTDLLNELLGSLAEPYAMSPATAFLLRNASLTKVKNLKTSAGELVGNTYVAQSPAPFYADAYVPTMAANAKSILCGDWSRYIVRMVNGLRFERSDDFAFDSDKVTFRAILRADGALINTDAIKHFANSAT